MKKADLYNLASTTSREILNQNQDIINKRIHEILNHRENESKLSTSDAIASAMALSVTLVPEISAAVTAKMLVDLGLISLEEEN